MSMTIEHRMQVVHHELELVTFHVGDVLLGIDIQEIQEIGRQLDVVPVPHAPLCIRGVVNLRGEVVTVLDLRTILGMGATPLTPHSRNLIIQTGSERIGLLVDRMAAVVTANAGDIDPPPPNLPVAHSCFIRGVHRMEGTLLGILAVQELLRAEA